VLLALAIAGLFLLPAPWNVVGVCAAALVEVGEIYLWRRYLRRYRVRVGAEALVGERAEVITSCAPDGRVRLRGEIWSAHSTEPVGRGRQVEIIGIEGLTLEVSPVDPV
jgi:membrane-bound serine protease (ClpP class)